MHEPLSQKLGQILEAHATAEGITLNQLMERTQGRGFHLVVILLVLPFIVPVSIPGSSAVLGLAVVLLTLRLAFGHSPRLPKFIGGRKLSPLFRQKVLGSSVKFLRFVEKFIKPRKTRWLAANWAVSANALVMTYLGLLLALPFPPLPPFTNSFPAYSIIIVAVSMMEEDGVMIWAGYAASLATSLYLFFVAEGLQFVFLKAYHWLQHL